MRISDWSSDVCSSDLLHGDPGAEGKAGDPDRGGIRVVGLQVIQRRGGIRQFADAVVEGALAAADAAEVEAPHRKAALGEDVKQVVGDRKSTRLNSSH